jgi:hypothetical protein
MEATEHSECPGRASLPDFSDFRSLAAQRPLLFRSDLWPSCQQIAHETCKATGSHVFDRDDAEAFDRPLETHNLHLNEPYQQLYPSMKSQDLEETALG